MLAGIDNITASRRGPRKQCGAVTVHRPSLRRINRRLSLIPLVLSVAAACESLDLPPVGSIAGLVVIEGQGIGGVAVSLSNGAATVTAPTGAYRFDQVEGGPHAVSISGYPLDATFDVTSTSVEIVSQGQTVIVEFRGEYIRTGSLLGRVSIDGRGVVGISVHLEGMSEGLTATDGSGQFGFHSLRAGSYSVSISGFGTAYFPATTQAVSLAIGQSRVANFEGFWVPPDLTGTYHLVSISSDLITGGMVLKHPHASGTLSLRQSAPVENRASGTMSMRINVPDGLGGTTVFADSGSYSVHTDGTWEQIGNLNQARGTYKVVGDTLTVETTEPALAVSSIVWRREGAGAWIQAKPGQSRIVRAEHPTYPRPSASPATCAIASSFSPISASISSLGTCRASTWKLFFGMTFGRPSRSK